MISSLSFIIIARNESFAIRKCLDSIASMPLEDCEVICVDSDSSDDTLEVMKAYAGKIANLRIVHCFGPVNAAGARNAGLRYATKKAIFFVDGDVELYPEFICQGQARIESGAADAVTGKLHEIEYSPGFSREVRRQVRRKHMTVEKRCLMTGGIFIVTREMSEAVGEWDSSFWRSQDLDYTLRISRRGTLLQLPVFIGVHHTQQAQGRSWEHFLRGQPLLYGKLLRKSLDRPRLFLGLLRRNRGLATFLLIGLVLLSGGVAAGFSSIPLPAVLMAVLLCVLIDGIYSVVIKKWRPDQWLLHNYLAPPVILCGLFTGTGRAVEKADVREIDIR